MPEVVRGQSKKLQCMENVKKCLEKHLGNDFQIKDVDNDLELTPKADSIYGIYLQRIVDVVSVFKKNMYIGVELKKGIYIRIY